MNDDTRTHQEVWALLPWLANGSATVEQRRHAEAHLRGCASCRAELARERELVDGLAQPPASAPDVERGLQRLMRRLDQAADAPPVLVRGPGRVRALAGTRLRIGTVAALGLAELLVVAAAALWWAGTPAPADATAAPYRTLTQRVPGGAGATDGPHWRVVFQGKQTVHDLQALLREHGLAIVAGPTEAGVFTLGVATQGPAGNAPDADALAARLRQSPAVLFAETVSNMPHMPHKESR